MTSAVRYRFRAELRTRRRAWLGLGLLVGPAPGAILVASVIASLSGQLAARTRLAATLRSE